MPRHRGPIWLHFTEETQTGYRTPRARCIHCRTLTSASVPRMTNHLASCQAVPRAVGRLAEALSETPGPQTLSPSVVCRVQATAFPHVSTEHRAALDQAFADAMHRSGSSFSLFDNPDWRTFFDLLNPQWTPPRPEQLSTTFLSGCYMATMAAMASELRKAPAITIGVDGATNVLSRSMSNVIAHDPRPWFVEYLASDLKRESQPQVTEKIRDTIERLHSYVNKEVVYAFISDSCNLMRSVRRALDDGGVVTFTYGCVAHALNNLCEDLVKLASIAPVVKDAVYVSKTVKNQGLINKIYSELCHEMFGKYLAMVLYTASRWSSINFMFVRLGKVKRAVVALFNAVMNERVEREIDEEFQLPRDLSATIIDPTFWQGIALCERIFDPICKCIGVLESTTATMSTAYAAFLAVYVHVKTVLSDSEGEVIMSKLLYRWDRIYSPVHALAFYCDPYYADMRRDLTAEHGRWVLELGKGEIYGQCREALWHLCRLDENRDTLYRAVLVEFMAFCSREHAIMDSWKNIAVHQPRMVWTQARGEFPVLSSLLERVYSSPASTAGVERQHKVSKRIHNATRNRMDRGKVEKQSAVAHNSAVASMKMSTVRHPFEAIIRRACTSPTGFAGLDLTAVEEATALEQSDARVGGMDDEDLDELIEQLTDFELAEQDSLALALAGMATIDSIPHELLHPFGRLDLTE